MDRKPKRKNIACMLRKFNTFPNGAVWRDDDDLIHISYRASDGGFIQGIVCSQADARLIARRINQFIDAGG
jgi:hypothetical protein